MGEGVVADVMTFRHEALHEIRIGFGVLTNDEKAGVDTFVLQDVEYFWRPVGIRTVVERERELSTRVASALDDERGRHRLVSLVDNLTGLVVNLKTKLAFGGRLGHA